MIGSFSFFYLKRAFQDVLILSMSFTCEKGIEMKEYRRASRPERGEQFVFYTCGCADHRNVQIMAGWHGEEIYAEYTIVDGKINDYEGKWGIHLAYNDGETKEWLSCVDGAPRYCSVNFIKESPFGTERGRKVGEIWLGCFLKHVFYHSDRDYACTRTFKDGHVVNYWFNHGERIWEDLAIDA